MKHINSFLKMKQHFVHLIAVFAIVGCVPPLAIIPNQGSSDFDNAWTIASKGGVSIAQLVVDWPYYENGTYPGTYAPAIDILGIANSFYPVVNTPLHVFLTVIDTAQKRVPLDLMGMDWSSSTLLTRFNNFQSYVFSKLANSTIASYSIGNEVDNFIGTNYTGWVQFINFFVNAKAYAKSIRPNISVSCKLTYDAYVNSAIIPYTNTINNFTDHYSVTYYPITNFMVRDPTVIHSELGQMLDSNPSKNFSISEIGYPSSPLCNSSETKQSLFFQEMFKFAQNRSSRLNSVLVNWLHDVDNSTLEKWKTYYGSSNPAFIGYLATLGLRNYNLTDKLAWPNFKCAAFQAGYTTAVCTTPSPTPAPTPGSTTTTSPTYDTNIVTLPATVNRSDSLELACSFILVVGLLLIAF